MLADSQAREQALDPRGSYIVQAPAGSGKTSLLIARILTLLAQAVDSPEQVLAVTFTNKAASEMQARLIEALQAANKPAPNHDQYALHNWQLARQVLAQDAKLGWGLLDNPHRLQIMTIDAFCLQLVKRMPFYAQSSVGFQLTDFADQAYERAAHTLWEQCQKDPAMSASVAQLLSIHDNQLDKLMRFFVELLATRDQWLPLIGSVTGRDSFESLATQQWQWLTQYLKAQVLVSLDQAQVSPMLHFAASHLQLPVPSSDWDICQLLAKVSLTQSGQWRKTVDKRVGFPAATSTKQSDEKATYKQMKTEMVAWLADQHDNEALRLALSLVGQAPSLADNQAAWQLLEVLLPLLPRLAAYLQIEWQTTNQMDFTELTLKANQALGELSTPSDLQLYCDQQIHHLLIDEFQDTSDSQYVFFQQLIAGWQANENRSLFVVGDPMQSIYRFRGAEVGLFLEVKSHGFGDWPVQFLSLSSNFRAHAGLIDWYNQIFGSIFPAQSDPTLGAIGYHAATSVKETKSDFLYHYHYEADQPADQAAQIIKLIQEIQCEDAQSSIAILARSRSQLPVLLAALKTADIDFNAPDIDPLMGVASVHDLMIMVRAMTNLADRLAWFAWLRTPLVGATKADLDTVASHGAELNTVYEAIMQCHVQLSPALQQRLTALIPLWQRFIEQQGRLNWTQWVARLWQLHGGDSYYAQTVSAVQKAIELLEPSCHNGHLDVSQWQLRLARQMAPNYAQQAQVQVMTIHRAKGLEFDCVILPNLATVGMRDQHQLMLFNRLHLDIQSIWLLAPLAQTDDASNQSYKFLREIEQHKAIFEQLRILYVAVTRAKNKLITFTAIKHDEEKGELPPPKQSFAALLMPWLHDSQSVVAAQLSQAQLQNSRNIVQQSIATKTQQLLTTPMSIDSENNQWQTQQQPLLSLWRQRYYQRLGECLHYVLQQIGSQDLQTWLQRTTAKDFVASTLTQFGIGINELPAVYEKITLLLTQLAQSEHARWIFGEQTLTAVEMPLYYRSKDKYHKVILDRTFVDTHNTRWIIDFKFPIDEDNAKLSRAQYIKQLQFYAAQMAKQDSRPISLALYYPLFDSCEAWSMTAQNAPL